MQRLDLNDGPLALLWRDNTVAMLYEVAKRAPGEALSLGIGTDSVLLLQDPGHIRHVLHERTDNYRKNFGGFQSLFGESRFTSDGSRWEFLQKLSQPHISAARPNEVAASAAAAFSGAAAAILDARDDNGDAVVDRYINRAAARVISDVSFGFGHIDVDAVLEDFREVLRLGTYRNWNIGGAVRVESPEQRERYRLARERMQEVIAQVVRDAHEDPSGSALVRDIEAGRTGGADVVEEISSLLFAGFDTTAAAVGWGLFLLSAAPDLQVTLRQKVREALAAGGTLLDALERVPELQAFQQEVLRIFPPVPLTGRTAVDTDSFDGVEVTQNQVVLISFIGLHHNPKLFPSPAFVRLQRYHDGVLPRDQQGSHMPFGSGKRACAGSRIANVELAVAFATLLDALEFELVDRSPLRFEWTGSLRRLGGHRFRVRPAA